MQVYDSAVLASKAIYSPLIIRYFTVQAPDALAVGWVADSQQLPRRLKLPQLHEQSKCTLWTDCPRNGVRNTVAVVDPFRMHFDIAHYNRIDPWNGVSHSVSGVNRFIMRIYFAHVSGVSENLKFNCNYINSEAQISDLTMFGELLQEFYCQGAFWFTYLILL